ncbi:RNA-binding protein NOB1, partial [Phenoliferia sp. Uapishka_3]
MAQQTRIPGIKHLVVDTGALITSPVSSLRGIALSYLVTPDVVNELRDKKGREVLQEAQIQLVPPPGSEFKAGFVVRQPTVEAVAKGESLPLSCTFTRTWLTALHPNNIRVLALCLTIELEENGSWRVRDHPGQVLTGPPKPEGQVEPSPEDAATAAVASLTLDSAPSDPEPVASTSGTNLPQSPEIPVVEQAEVSHEDEPAVEEEEEEEADEEEDGDDSGAESDDSHDSSSSWITPDNVTSHKVKDLGLFTPPENDVAKPPKTIMKAAVLTGDFAMQNVALQMGLNVLGSGGKRVREVRTWVLRCHACYKICKDPEKRFCPSCGGPTLIRTSITYVTATPENPSGYILHLKANFQYRLRGTRYSLPNPKMGRAGGGMHSEQVLREDQKEWVRGVKTADVMRSKETRAILRSVMDDKTRGARGLGPRQNEGSLGGGFGGYADRDWQAPMNLGEKGRKRGGKNGGSGEVRLDSSGMPVIGSGRKNKLALLTSSLSKSKRITDRMTSMLSDFDDRLARLEKSLVPIHKQTGKLQRVGKNIEATLRSIDGLLGFDSLLAKESPVITAGPNSNDLKPYLASIDRLVGATEALRKTDAKGQSATLASMGTLVETGARQLVQVFSRWVKDTSPSMDAGSLFDKGKPFPPLSPYFLENAIPLIATLRALPDMGPKILKDLEFAYADVRAGYVEDSLKNCGKEVLVDATPSTTPDTRRGLGRFLDVLFALAKSEHALLATVFSLTPAATRKDIYASILPPALGILYTTGQQLNALIKKSLHSLVSIAFASFAELQERSPEFEEWIRAKAGRKDNEIGELLHAFRGSCLTSLPEFIDDTKSWGMKAPTASEASSVGVNSMTINVVTFMRQLSDNQATVESFLSVLGAGNWGGPPARSPISGQEEDTLITRYLNDVLVTLLNSLDTRSRSLRNRTGIAAIFLLNNLSYIRREVLSSQIGDLLGEACEDSLNKRMRSTKASYLEVRLSSLTFWTAQAQHNAFKIWSPLVSALLDAGIDQSGVAGGIKAGISSLKGGDEKRETKDRFVRFHDAFEEVESLHAAAKLDEGEQELRERLKGEVERMIVPTYTKFLARHRNGEFSKNPSKYLKLDVEQLVVRMESIFD